MIRIVKTVPPGGAEAIRRLLLASVACAVAGSLLHPAVGGAQVRRLIPGEPTCAECSVALEPITSLADVGTPASFSDYISIMRGADGQWIVISPIASHQMSVFAPSGAFLRIVGRQGAGPGEYRLALPAGVDERGMLHVLDPLNARYTVLSPDFTPHVETQLAILRVSSTLLLKSGELVVNAVQRTPQHAGLPLHVLSQRGWVRSFGRGNVSYRSDSEQVLRRVLAPDTGRTFWASHTSAYVIERWSVDGELLAVYSVDAEWFKPWHRRQGPSDVLPAEPTVSGIWPLGEDRVLVIIHIGDASFRPLAPAGGSGHRTLSGDDAHRIMDTIVDVIDLRRGVVIVRQRFDRVLYAVRGSAELYGYRGSASGEPQFEIFRPVISSTRRQE